MADNTPLSQRSKREEKKGYFWGQPTKSDEPHAWGLEDEISLRIETEPLPASSGSGVDGHLLMRWEEWAGALWNRYGSNLIKRERDIALWASNSGYDEPAFTAVSLLSHVPNRHALFADTTPKPTFPYPRNRVRIPMTKSGRLEVSIADYNRYSYALKNKQPTVELQPTTIALSPFPKSSSLIVTPKIEERVIPMWEAIAGPVISTGTRKFDTHFMTYARDVDWARETLTSELKRWIYEMKDVRVMADRDSLICIDLAGWSATQDLDDLADLSFSISKSARDALGSLR